MSGKRVFISYRRSDSAGHAGRLYDYLKTYFGEDRIFFDFDTIKPGVDFEQKIRAELENSEAVLVLIGNQWLSASDADGKRRLDDPRDYVRLEVETALNRNVMVIPILLEGINMPAGRELPESLSELSQRNAISLSNNHWKSDLGVLTAILQNTLGVIGSVREQRIRRYRQVVFVLSVLGALLSIVNNLLFAGTSGFLPLLIKLTYLVILAGNTVFVTYLLVNMKQELDRLGAFTIITSVVALMLVAWGGTLSSFTPIPLLIVAWLVNFIRSDV